SASSSGLARAVMRFISGSEVPGGAVQCTTTLRSLKAGRFGEPSHGRTAIATTPAMQARSGTSTGARIARRRARRYDRGSAEVNDRLRGDAERAGPSRSASAGVTVNASAIDAITASAYASTIGCTNRAVGPVATNTGATHTSSPTGA